MITLQDLCSHLDRLLACDAIEDFCPNGLQVEGSEQVDKVATGVTADLATIEAAAEWGANALVVHHGIFWKGAPVRLVHGMGKRVRTLMENSISLLCYHLPLDAHEEVGNNWVAGQDLGMHEREPFGWVRGAQIGVKGRIQPTPIAEWVKQVEAYYEHPAHVALGGPDVVKKVALIAGSGHRFIEEAARSGVDCLITGSYDLPVWPTAHEEGVHFIAVGHSNSERVGPKALATHIEKRFHVKTRFIDTTNPF